MALYVQYGCGLEAPDGWLNYDASPSLRIRKIPLIGKSLAKVPFSPAVIFGDICRGLPLADGSVEAVYCSHTLEHLALEDCRLALRNTLRLLRPGGVFRLVLPDIKGMAKAYVASSDTNAATVFVDRTGMGRHNRSKGLRGLAQSWMGNAPHLWMWDYPSLSDELSKAGFVQIRPAGYADGGDPMFGRVEKKERWEDDVVGIHCNRPS